MTRTRRTPTAHRVAAVVVGVLLALPLAAAVVVSTAAPASASTYRYWTYWWGTNSGKPHTGWQFAPQGPAAHRVSDGWVVGWRFETTTTTGRATPRTSANFATLCPALAAQAPVSGQVRVALVLDYGTASDAPPGQSPPTTSQARLECFTLPASPAPSGLTVLQQAAHGAVVVRSDNGLVCALDGYPQNECAPVVPDPTPTPTRTPSPSATSTHRPAPTPTSAATSARPGTAPSSASGAVVPVAATTTGAAATGSGTGSASASASATGTATAAVSSAAPTPDGSTSESTLPAVAGAPVSTTEPAGGSPVGLVVGAVVVAAVAGSAYWTSRRGGRSS